MKARGPIALGVSMILLVQGCFSRQVVSRYDFDAINDADEVFVTTMEGTPHACEHKLSVPRINSVALTGVGDDGKRIEIPFEHIGTIRITGMSGWTVVVGLLIGGLCVGALAVVADKLDTDPPPPSDNNGEDGSCPYFYSYNGSGWVLDAEPYGGAITRGLQRTEVVGLENLAEVEGEYRLRVSNELQEVQYIDEVRLVVVDHEPGLTVAPKVSGRILTLSDPRAPVSAFDGRGRDVLPLLKLQDGRVWESEERKRDPAVAGDVTDELLVEFVRPAKAGRVKLLVHGSNTRWATQVSRAFLGAYGGKLDEWYRDVDGGGPALERVLGWYQSEELYILKILVKTRDGWEPRGHLFGGGPYAPEYKVYVLDLEGVEGDRLRIKLRPPAYFWRLDRLAVDYGPEREVAKREIRPLRAVGLEGQDLLGKVSKADRDYLVLEDLGESAELTFAAPGQKPGSQRTVFLKANGYYRVKMQPRGEPRVELLDKIFNQPGFSARYALEVRERRLSRVASP